MNLYLENTELWGEVHHLLMTIMAEVLNSQLLPKYPATIEKRVYEIEPEKELNRNRIEKQLCPKKKTF